MTPRVTMPLGGGGPIEAVDPALRPDPGVPAQSWPDRWGWRDRVGLSRVLALVLAVAAVGTEVSGRGELAALLVAVFAVMAMLADVADALREQTHEQLDREIAYAVDDATFDLDARWCAVQPRDDGETLLVFTSHDASDVLGPIRDRCARIYLRGGMLTRLRDLVDREHDLAHPAPDRAEPTITLAGVDYRDYGVASMVAVEWWPDGNVVLGFTVDRPDAKTLLGRKMGRKVAVAVPPDLAARLLVGLGHEQSDEADALGDYADEPLILAIRAAIRTYRRGVPRELGAIELGVGTGPGPNGDVLHRLDGVDVRYVHGLSPGEWVLRDADERIVHAAELGLTYYARAR